MGTVALGTRHGGFHRNSEYLLLSELTPLLLLAAEERYFVLTTAIDELTALHDVIYMAALYKSVREM